MSEYLMRGYIQVMLWLISFSLCAASELICDVVEEVL
jgi:hypothetical protein